MMAHRSFLLALLAATFMCIVVFQMSLDVWILGGTVHYTVGVVKKDEADVPVKISAPRHSSAKSSSQNSHFSSEVLNLDSSSISIQSLQPKAASTTSSTLLQRVPLLETPTKSSPSESQSPTFSPQTTRSNSSNVLLPQLMSTSFINSSINQAMTVIPSNLLRQNSESVASSFSSRLPVLPTVSKIFPPPQQTSSSSNVSQLSESKSRKLSSLLHSTSASGIRREISAARSFADVRQPSPTDPEPQSRQEIRPSDKVEARIKVRSFERGMKSRGILQRKQPPEFISPQAKLQEILKQSSAMQVRSRADPLRSLRSVPTVSPATVTHVILLTYFRSGSTFVGDLLQQNWKTFYHFEPLHFMTYDSRIGKSKLREAFDLFNSILRCNFSNEGSYLRWAKKPDNQFLFERNVFLWFSCKANPRMCFTPELVSAVCQRAPVQVMKVTRLHMRDLREFLSQNPDIKTKVVYLTRDPRGVISSRRTLDWCSNTQCSDPHILCTEMEDDIRVFNELRERDPDRFIQVMYEDISLNPEREARRLFEFLGLPFSLSVQRFLKTHTTARKADNLNPYSTRRNSSSMAFSWRSRLTFPQVISIQGACSEVIHQLNYTLITSRRELYNRQGTKSSVNSNISDFRAVNLKTLDTAPLHSNETVGPTSNARVVEKNLTISNYGENNAFANTKRRMIAEISVDELESVKNSSDSFSAIDRLRSRMDRLHTYNRIIKNR